MARPRRWSDDDILEAARACFLEHGPACPTSTIAERLGLSQAALFKRFGTKEELLVRALMPPQAPPFLGLVEAGPDDRPVCEQLVEIGLTISSYLHHLMPRVAALQFAGVPPRRLLERYAEPPPLRVQRALTGWLERARDQRAIELTEPHATAMAFLGALQARTFVHHALGESLADPQAPEDYVRAVVDVLWRGIAPEAAP